MSGEIERTLKVDENGWAIIPADIKVLPRVPGEGRVTHAKTSPDGRVMVRQETSAGPRLWLLSVETKAWTEIEAANG